MSGRFPEYRSPAHGQVPVPEPELFLLMPQARVDLIREQIGLVGQPVINGAALGAHCTHELLDQFAQGALGGKPFGEEQVDVVVADTDNARDIPDADRPFGTRRATSIRRGSRRPRIRRDAHRYGMFIAPSPVAPRCVGQPLFRSLCRSGRPVLSLRQYADAGAVRIRCRFTRRCDQAGQHSADLSQ
ncbi:hypothetical protein ADL22_05810 [Streptomyces sp. NRRL F-4489]|nr:hypothetical protein ADL22_05810 [Streptomyces sp. NRRL F-4489]